MAWNMNRPERSGARMAGLEAETGAEERAVSAVFSVLQEALGSPTGTEDEAGHVYTANYPPA